MPLFTAGDAHPNAKRTQATQTQNTTQIGGSNACNQCSSISISPLGAGHKITVDVIPFVTGLRDNAERSGLLEAIQDGEHHYADDGVGYSRADFVSPGPGHADLHQ